MQQLQQLCASFTPKLVQMESFHGFLLDRANAKNENSDSTIINSETANARTKVREQVFSAGNWLNLFIFKVMSNN